MGTRGIYKFIDQDSAYYVYKHWDNYPSGAAVFIQNTLKLAWKLPRFEADEFSASFIAANKKEGGGVRLMHELEGDKTNIIASLREMWIEYLYEISCKDNKLHIKAIDIQKGACCFDGALDEFSAHYPDDRTTS